MGCIVILGCIGELGVLLGLLLWDLVRLIMIIFVLGLLDILMVDCGVSVVKNGDIKVIGLCLADSNGLIKADAPLPILLLHKAYPLRIFSCSGIDQLHNVIYHRTFLLLVRKHAV